MSGRVRVPEIVGARYEVLYRLKQWQEEPQKDFFLLTPARGALQQIGPFLGDVTPIHLALGESEYELNELAEQLIAFGYTRVDLVSRRGEMAVRGGILDVFPVTEDRPVRVDFFGSEIDSLKHFSVSDQRSLPEDLAEVLLFPAREILLTPQIRATAEGLVERYPEWSIC